MAGKRDEFLREIGDIAAKRVGLRCSNPNCRKPTAGPQVTQRKAVNIGVAAHISAAAKGGPRYDPNMLPEERSAIENCIWLCQNHAKLVDNDPARYTSDILRRWRRIAEEAALMEIESSLPSNAPLQDVELIKFYCQCFDRPAFQDPFHQEGSMEAFDRAIEDTITALNTGCLRSRDGAILQQSKGKGYVSRPEWREKLDLIVDMLRTIRSRYEVAVKQGLIHLGPDSSGQRFYCFHDASIAHWMDETRSQIIAMLSEICHESAVQPPRGPRSRRPGW
jgi:hypothetical protein